MYRQRKNFYSKENERWEKFVKKYNLDQIIPISACYELIAKDNSKYIMKDGHKSIFNKTLYNYVCYGTIDKEDFNEAVDCGMILAEVYDDYDIRYKYLKVKIDFTIQQYVYNRIWCQLLKEKIPIASKFKWRV